MKKILLTLIAFAFLTPVLQAQMTAMNFNRNDCDGNPQHLFADLNSGKAVIIEYFMTSCAPCPAAGQKLESMKANLLQQYPGMVKSYAIAFNNTYSCTTVKNWVTSNGFTSIPMDSGATQVAYYGGMGMPTIIIAAGANHQLLGSPYIGFNTSDTTQMAANIRSFLGSQVGLKERGNQLGALNIFPNPSSSEVNISFSVYESTVVSVDVVDLTGRIVARLLHEDVPAGRFSRYFGVDALPAGFYSLRIKAGGAQASQKLSIVK